MQKLANNYAFIDSQNLNLSIQAQGWKVDYRRFMNELEAKLGYRRAKKRPHEDDTS